MVEVTIATKSVDKVKNVLVRGYNALVDLSLILESNGEPLHKNVKDAIKCLYPVIQRPTFWCSYYQKQPFFGPKSTKSESELVKTLPTFLPTFEISAHFFGQKPQN